MTKKTFDISTSEARANFVQEILSTANVVSCERMKDSNFTVVIARFADGWDSLGKSVCVSEADYNPATGEAIALQNAISDAETHYWRTIGYLANIGVNSIDITWDAHE